MTERDGRCDLSIAPGQVYIEVEYDYEYNAKDKHISIRQGECYMLVCKTNEDWWQVRREEGTKAFYVPAQYVREVRRALMPPPKPRAKPPNVLEITQCRSSNENLNQHSPTERSSFGRPPPRRHLPLCQVNRPRLYCCGTPIRTRGWRALLPSSLCLITTTIITIIMPTPHFHKDERNPLRESKVTWGSSQAGCRWTRMEARHQEMGWRRWEMTLNLEMSSAAALLNTCR